MRIELLREFIELARDLDFRATAARLNLAPSSLSGHIAEIEREVGFSLVSRWPSRALTPQGNQFLKYAYKITGLYDEALQRCADLGKGARQRVKIANTGMSPRVHKFLFALLAKYGREHPAVEFDCRAFEGKGSNVRDLLCGVVDIAFVASAVADPRAEMERQGIACAPLCREESAVWVARESSLARGEALAVADLDLYSFPLMTGPSFADYKRSLEENMAVDGAAPVVVPYHTESFQDYVLNAFGRDDVLAASRSFFEDIPEFALYPERVVKYFNPPSYPAFYLGRRLDETSPTVLDLYDYLLNLAATIDYPGLLRAE